MGSAIVHIPIFSKYLILCASLSVCVCVLVCIKKRSINNVELSFAGEIKSNRLEMTRGRVNDKRHFSSRRKPNSVRMP